MTVDINKDIESLIYNHLNLPIKINFGAKGNIYYLYNAIGGKVKKVVTEMEQTTTDYLSGFQYKKMGSEPVELQFFPHAEGYVHFTKPSGVNELGAFNYVFNYTDHLGNVRLSYAKDPLVGNKVKILEENHYYPFGLKHKNYNVEKLNFEKFPDTGVELVPMPAVANASYNYRFNQKEYQDELGLNWYDYQARNYDPALGRWMNTDPLAEMSRRFSPYTYCYDNPLVFVDYDGMFATPPLDYYNEDGRKIGTDGVNDGRKAVVKDSEQVKAIKKTDKSGGTTALSDVSSAVVLPSDTALNESLNVLDRTVKNGGKSEESSIVMNDGTVLKGEKGPEAQYGKDTYASATLPNLPEGKTPADAEATIHSHPTKAEVVNGKVYSGNATQPTAGENGDLPTFAQYNTNIIVGPLGQATATQGVSSSTGKMETNVNSAPLGISIYSGSNPTPVLNLNKKAVERIINK